MLFEEGPDFRFYLGVPAVVIGQGLPVYSKLEQKAGLLGSMPCEAAILIRTTDNAASCVVTDCDIRGWGPSSFEPRLPCWSCIQSPPAGRPLIRSLDTFICLY